MTGLLEVPAVALTVRQPWAWAFFCGARLRQDVDVKDVENRYAGTTRETPFRLAIHAAKQPVDDWRFAVGYIEGITRLPVPGKDEHVYGSIIGVVTVTSVHRAAAGCCTSRWGMPDARYHWRVTDPDPFDTPVPAVGALHPWTIPSDVRASVARELEVIAA